MLPVKRFTDYIEQNNLFARDSKILAAISGGIDSVLMAHLFKLSGYSFAIAHCNFQLRGAESESEEVFCKNLANTLSVPFHNVSFDTLVYTSARKISVQMAARELRYQWFEQIRLENEYDVIATAHHQNDSIETILLNLVRGTGIAGLHGIPHISGLLVRPLLCFNTREIEEMVSASGINYMQDSSNASLKYARNKIRHQVVPVLKELNPALERTFNDNIRRINEVEVWLNQQVAELRIRLFNYQGEEVSVLLADIAQLKPQRLLLFKLLEPYHFNENVIDDLISALHKHPGRVFESATHQLILDREKVVLINKRLSVDQAVSMPINVTEVDFGNYRMSQSVSESVIIIKNKPMVTCIDTEKLLYPLTIRQWANGDFFYPLGMKTRKKVSDFFISEKIPLHQKLDVPILVNGNGDIVWLGGYRLDERYKVTANTKKVTIFELFKPE